MAVSASSLLLWPKITASVNHQTLKGFWKFTKNLKDIDKYEQDFMKPEARVVEGLVVAATGAWVHVGIVGSQVLFALQTIVLLPWREKPWLHLNTTCVL